MTTPTHTTPANRPLRARVSAAWASSKEPGTQWISTASPVTAWSASVPRAPSSSFLEIGSLKRAATTAKRCPCAAAATRRLGATPAIGLVRERREEVAELLALGAEVAAVGLGGRDLERQPLHHPEPVALDA